MYILRYSIFVFIFLHLLHSSSVVYKRDNYYFSSKTNKLLNGKINFINKNNPHRIYYQAIFKNGLKNGLEKIYNKKGLIIRTVEYKNGIKDGKDIIYYNSGIKSIESIYKDDILVKKYFYNSEEKRDGYSQIFYPSGTLKVKSYYKNGKKDGIENIFYSNGSIYEVNIYSDGNLVNSESYNIYGKLISNKKSQNKQKKKIVVNKQKKKIVKSKNSSTTK